MAAIARKFARREGIIDSDVGMLWDVLTDWGNMEWWGNALEDDGMTVGDCSLEGEHGTVPRCKVIRRVVEGSDVPTENRETLFIEDKEAHRLYYTASDGFLPGVRNYVATWSFDEVDEVDAARTKMMITSTFDVTQAGDPDVALRIIEDVYEMIFKGLNDHMSARRAKHA